MHIKDVDLLHQLQAFFGGQGTLTTTSKVGRYTLVGISDIINLLIPHFNQGKGFEETVAAASNHL